MLSLKKACIFLLMFCLLISLAARSQTVFVMISGIRSSSGQIIISAFKDDKSFEEEKPFYSKKFDKGKMEDGTLFVKFTMPPGTYGLCLLDDENGDSVMNYSFLGLPKEGFGFSNYYLTKLSRPKLDEFDFVLDKEAKVLMRVKYM